jgi:hypothetical protein
VATVEVDLYDHRRKLAAIALFTMVAPDAVAGSYEAIGAAPPIHLIEAPFDEDQIIPSGERAGIVAALRLGEQGHQKGVFLVPDNVRTSVDGSVAAAFDCTVPWDQLECTGPEAACLAADAAIALPITRSYVAVEDVGPNADLTLRFTSAPAKRVIVVASTMLSVQRGTATVGLEVQAEDNQLAHGLATALLLRSS